MGQLRIAFAAHRSDDTGVARRRCRFMNFLSKLFGGKSTLGEEPVRLAHFDVAGWEEVERTSNHFGTRYSLLKDHCC
jgi:hypothetical protein